VSRGESYILVNHLWVFKDYIIILLIRYYIKKDPSLLITIEVDIYIDYLRDSTYSRRY